MWRQFLTALQKIFLTVYGTPQSGFIWPLISKGLWSKIKFSIWFQPLSFDYSSCKLDLNEKCKGILNIYVSRLLKWCFGSPIWCLFSFPTKAINIHNSHTCAIPKEGVHLGVIAFHPLHSPPFAKVCSPLSTFFGLWTFALHI